MYMRMQDLAERSGLPKTTIHHYTREGLLPAARKTAPNAALYDRDHLERLRLITRLRGDEFGGLSIPEIRRVLKQVDAGIDVRGAVRLVQEGVEARPPADGGWSTIDALARASGVAEEFVGELLATDLLGGDRGDEGFSTADLLVARACRDVCANHGVAPADLTPLAELIREVGNYSAALVQIHGARSGETPDESSAGSPEAVPVRGLDHELAALCDALLWRAMRPQAFL